MAICEGMKRSGQGTTGAALLRAGAGVVYGYSQSVTFAGDYVYEETFWNLMKDFENPATVAEAFAQMVEEHGICDPYGNAYPIVMSDVDAFPANPDSAQTVNSTWKLWGSFPLVDLTGFSLDITSADIKMAQTVNVNMSLVPEMQITLSQHGRVRTSLLRSLNLMQAADAEPSSPVWAAAKPKSPAPSA